MGNNIKVTFESFLNENGNWWNSKENKDDFDNKSLSSMRIANMYAELIKSDFDEILYDKYDKLVKRTGIPKNKLIEIETVVSKTNGDFRPIDVYKYW